MKPSFTDYDFSGLEDKVAQKKFYKLSDVQDRIEKVAFDVVRFKDSDSLEHLWQIQNTPDGDVIVAMYEEDDAQLESRGHWKAMADKENSINVFYKGEPIVRLAISSLGIPVEEAHSVCRYLPNTLASDSSMVKSLLKDNLSDTERERVLSRYPELREGV